MVTLAVTAFLFISNQFVSELKDFRLEADNAFKYKISYSYTTANSDYKRINKKVDPSRVGIVKTKLNMAIAEYLTGIAVIAVISTPLIFATRRKP